MAAPVDRLALYQGIYTGLSGEGSLPLTRHFVLLAVAVPRFAKADPPFWPAWAQGAWSTLPVVTNMPGVSLEVSGPGGVGSGRSQGSKQELDANLCVCVCCPIAHP